MVFIIRDLSAIFVLMSFLFAASHAKPPVFTPKEKEAINKLRTSVGSKLTANYMKSDAYLIKWLKAKNFDLNQAKEALEKTLLWRKEVDADNLPGVDFGSEVNKQYVIDFTSSKDLNGNPVVMIPFGDWDLLRKALEENIVSEMGRRLDYMEEKAAQLSFNATGDPTSLLIVDMQGFALRKHACVGCIPFYLNWVVHHEVHYPYNFYRVLCINTPQIFEPILSLMRPLMTAATRDAFKTIGQNRTAYAKDLSQFVDLNQLPGRFGGNGKKT